MAAPSLVNAIKLRSLVDQLNNVEFSQFLSDLVDLCGRHIILTPLFHQLTASSQTTSTPIEPDRIENIVEIARNIITSRDTPQKAITSPSFNSLSGDLIGEIASYLVHNEYACFSTVNRAAMIDCNTPNTLRNLRILHIYKSFDLQRYPSINRLFFSLPHFDKLRVPEKTVAANLQHLDLNCYGVDVNNTQGFTHPNVIYFNNITSLSLWCLESGDATLWRKILLKCPMVQHLFLNSVSTENFVSIRDIQNIFVNLKGLGIYQNLTNRFLGVYGHKLEYLHLDYTDVPLGFSGHAINSNIAFPKLQQLQLGLISNSDVYINHILQTANQLRKVSVTAHYKNTIENIITSQPLLEYVHFRLFPDALNCQVVFAGIESGLYNTRKINRKRFKISVEFDDFTTFGSNLILPIALIVHWLNVSKINEFMFLVRFSTRFTSIKKVKEIMKSVVDFGECEKNKKTIDVKTYCDGTDRSVVISITNKDCTINGFSESWMLNIERD